MREEVGQDRSGRTTVRASRDASSSGQRQRIDEEDAGESVEETRNTVVKQELEAQV